jgi:hypothetical protein
LSGDKSREDGRRRWHGNLSVGCYWTLFFKLETDRPDLCQECNTIAVSNEISSSIHNVVIERCCEGPQIFISMSADCILLQKCVCFYFASFHSS